MTPRKDARDAAASVRQRLLNLAHEEGLDYNLVLQRYAAERFLYRLSVSREVDRFTLKGASLLRVWAGQDLRPTRDIDLLGAGPDDPADVRAAMEAICTAPCPEDGVVLDPETMRIDEIRDEQPYGGFRVKLQGSLGQARLAVQVDIGFGDVITPDREERDYPTLLDLPAPRLWTYPRETFVAEKLEALVRLGGTNSRVRDLWDLACLARRDGFDGETLRTAIEETFRRRGTALGEERPEALRPGYYEDRTRARRWQELLRQVGASGGAPDRLEDAGEELRTFLGPVCDSVADGSPFTRAWPPGGPWKPGTHAREREDADA